MGLFDFWKKKRKCIMINDRITVTLINGDVLQFDHATYNLYERLANPNLSDEGVVSLYYDHTQKEKEHREASMTDIISQKEAEKATRKLEVENAQEEIRVAEGMRDNFSVLTNTGDFTEKDGSVYMTGIELSMPTLLIGKFMTVIARIDWMKDTPQPGLDEANDEYQALKNFWMWCSLCPNPQSREDLFNWITTNGLKINKNGFFFAYRKVVSVDNEEEYNDEVITRRRRHSRGESSNKALSEFISNSWLKVKGQKKSPKNYSVEQLSGNGDYHLVNGLNGNVGNLDVLYHNITTTSTISGNEDDDLAQTYTDAHTGTMDIRIGQEVSLPAEKCDWNNLESCSNGLHIRGNRDHGCGDTTIIVLVNPMNVVAVPVYDNTKMRVRAYFPVAVISQEEDMKILNSINTLELADEYLADQVDGLNELIERNTPTELLQHRVMADLSPSAIRLIAKQVTNIKDTLSKRVVNI